MTTLTRAEILARKIHGKTEPFELDGGEVLIRGLTHSEALEVRDQDTTLLRMCVMISRGIVNPAMSVDDVRAWSDADEAGVLTRLSERISELSGMSEGAGKSRVPGTRRRK